MKQSRHTRFLAVAVLCGTACCAGVMDVSAQGRRLPAARGAG
jgi:hypothetical protein